MTRTEAQETLDLNEVHNIDKETYHDHQRFRSSSISHAQDVPERAEERRTREQVPPSGQRIKNPGHRRQEDHLQGEALHAADELSTCGRDQSPGIGEQNLASGRMRFAGALRAKVTSERVRPLTAVEVPDENEASDGRHEERCSAWALAMTKVKFNVVTRRKAGWTS